LELPKSPVLPKIAKIENPHRKWLVALFDLQFKA